MRPTERQVAEFSRSPAAFRQWLTIDTGHTPRAYSAVADSWQEADFAALDAGWLRAVGREAEGGRGRGHSKTCALSIRATWALAFSQRRLSGVAAAADRDQAKLLRDAMSRLVE